MINEANIFSIGLFLISVFMAGVAQVFLKKAAMRENIDLLHEYLDWRVMLGYGIMFGCTFITVIAYRNMPLSLGMILETISYLNVTVFGVIFFREKITGLRIVALGLIIVGILLYAS